MNIKLIASSTIALLFFWQCKNSSNQVSPTTQPTLSVIQEGLLDCFEPTWDSTKNQWTFCEVSACLFLDNQLFMASDKRIPQHSSVFTFPLSTDFKVDTSITYIDQPSLKQAQKYEDFSLSPDKKHIFLTTGFDRIKEDNHSWDSYNTLLAWSSQKDPQIIDSQIYNEQVASLSLRKKISQALANDDFPQGMPYFKVEGLAILPEQKLLFGIRELGKKYDDFDYTILFLETSYKIEKDGSIILNTPLRKVYEFIPQARNYPSLHLPIALSSIEYDPLTDKIYMTTSFEQKGKIGAYLWELTPQMLAEQAAPRLFHNKNKTPYQMNHKAEGVTILNKNHLFLVHDDDRELIDGRQAHQTAYTIVKLE